MSLDKIQPAIKYEVLCCTNFLSIETIRTAISSADVRKTLYQNGIDAATRYLLQPHDIQCALSVDTKGALSVDTKGAL
jgi:hypothetical protein